MDGWNFLISIIYQFVWEKKNIALIVKNNDSTRKLRGTKYKLPCFVLISHASLYVNRNSMIDAADKHIRGKNRADIER